MNRDKREWLINQRKKASDTGETILDKLQGQGFYKGQDNPPKEISGQDIQDLLEYIISLEERITALEAALNLNISPQ